MLKPGKTFQSRKPFGQLGNSGLNVIPYLSYLLDRLTFRVFHLPVFSRNKASGASLLYAAAHVMTRSAFSSISAVRSFGFLSPLSIPISCMAATTAELTWDAGWVPAEMATAVSCAIWSKKASAIWLRPELCMQTKSTFFIAT